MDNTLSASPHRLVESVNPYASPVPDEELVSIDLSWVTDILFAIIFSFIFPIWYYFILPKYQRCWWLFFVVCLWCVDAILYGGSLLCYLELI